MKWSRYSILFESKRNGWLLFNTVSRSFLTVAETQLPTIRAIMADPEGARPFLGISPVIWEAP